MKKIEQVTADDVKNFKKVLGENIRFYRTSKSLTQEELAEFAGVENTTLSNLELGISQAKIETLLNISNALGVAPHEFYAINCKERQAAKNAKLEKELKETKEKLRQADEKLKKFKTFKRLISKSLSGLPKD